MSGAEFVLLFNGEEVSRHPVPRGGTRAVLRTAKHLRGGSDYNGWDVYIEAADAGAARSIGAHETAAGWLVGEKGTYVNVRVRSVEKTSCT